MKLNTFKLTLLISVVTTLFAPVAFGQISGTAPQLFFRETDQTLPLGMWHIQVDGDKFVIEKNTANNGGFGTATTIMSVTGGNVSFVGNFGIGATLFAPGAPLHLVAPNIVDGSNFHFNIKTNDTTAMAAGVGGGIAFSGIYTGTTQAVFAGIQGFKENATDNNFSGALRFYTRSNGGQLTENLTLSSTGNLTIPTTNARLIFGSTGYLTSTSTDGVWGLYNNAGSDWGRLQFGGTSASFPALRRSGTSLQVRLADDSGYGPFAVSTLTADTAVQAGVGTNTAGTIYGGGNVRTLAYLDTAVTNAGAPSSLVFRQSRGTQAARLDTVNGDQVGSIFANVFSGGTEFSISEMRTVVDGTFTSGQRPPSRIEFYTNLANGAQTATLSMSPVLLSMNSGVILDWNGDLKLTRISAGVLGLVNSTAPQAFRIQGTTVGGKYLQISHDGTEAVYNDAAGTGHYFQVSGTTKALQSGSQFRMASDVGLGWDTTSAAGGGSQDITLSRLSAGVLALSPGSLAIGTSPAASGLVRFGNNGGLNARTAANNADFTLIGSNSSNNVLIGDGAQASIYQGATNTFNNGIALGINHAVTGIIAIGNNVGIVARNAANSTDFGVIGFNSADHVVISSSAADIQWGVALIGLGGGAAPTLGTIGGSGPGTAGQNSWMRVLDSTGAAFWVPVWK